MNIEADLLTLQRENSDSKLIKDVKNIIMIIFYSTDRTKEIQRTGNVKTKVISVIIKATGTISEALRKYLSTLSGRHNYRKQPNWPMNTYCGKN